MLYSTLHPEYRYADYFFAVNLLASAIQMQGCEAGSGVDAVVCMLNQGVGHNLSFLASRHCFPKLSQHFEDETPLILYCPLYSQIKSQTCKSFPANFFYQMEIMLFARCDPNACVVST